MCFELRVFHCHTKKTWEWNLSADVRDPTCSLPSTDRYMDLYVQNNTSSRLKVHLTQRAHFIIKMKNYSYYTGIRMPHYSYYYVLFRKSSVRFKHWLIPSFLTHSLLKVPGFLPAGHWRFLLHSSVIIVITIISLAKAQSCLCLCLFSTHTLL